MFSTSYFDLELFVLVGWVGGVLTHPLHFSFVQRSKGLLSDLPELSDCPGLGLPSSRGEGIVFNFPRSPSSRIRLYPVGSSSFQIVCDERVETLPDVGATTPPLLCGHFPSTRLLVTYAKLCAEKGLSIPYSTSSSVSDRFSKYSVVCGFANAAHDLLRFFKWNFICL